MSDKQIDEKIHKIHKLPLIIKKESLQSGPSSRYGVIFRCMSSSTGKFLREDIIYKAKDDDFFRGKYPNLLLMNKLDVVKNSSRTTATYDSPNLSIIELTSDAVVETIGQENYDIVFTALCSVISQELKVKGILSLLTLSSDTETIKHSTVETQTYESSYTELVRAKQRRTRRTKLKVFKSYVVPDHVKAPLKKIIIHPCTENLNTSQIIKDEVSDTSAGIKTEDNIKLVVLDTHSKTGADGKYSEQFIRGDKRDSNNGEPDLFPDLKLIVDDDSIISDVSVGSLSVGSTFHIPDIETNANKILSYIDQHTEDIRIEEDMQIATVDGSQMMIKGNIDPFHLASPVVLKDFLPEDQKRLMLHQAYIDWKYCLQQDEDGNLPIHVAVLNRDVGLLKRQCLVLKSRNESVDRIAPGNLTALQMAIFHDSPECTSILLAHGADLLVRDDESRTTLHLAAERGAKHIEAILTHCTKNAREILKEDEELWRPELENKSDSKLADYLITKLSTICDNQGYTPLMLASKNGNYANVELLAKAAPSTINMAMPNSGNTALYLAVGASCIEAGKLGDKSKLPENYENTIGILVERGADPSIDNNSGSNVNILLTEFNIVKLSMLIANKIASAKYFHGVTPKNCDSYMLVKDDRGEINIKEMIKSKEYKNQPIKLTNKSVKSPPLVVVAETVKSNKTQEEARTGSKTTPKIAKKFLESDVDKTVSSVNEQKPVTLNNLSVVTKTLSIKNNKFPILVRSKKLFPESTISLKPGTCKGLRLTNSINTKLKSKKSATQKGTPSNPRPLKYLTILPKTDLDITKPRTTVGKKIPIILKNTAIKRHLSTDDKSEASSSKVTKTKP